MKQDASFSKTEGRGRAWHINAVKEVNEKIHLTMVKIEAKTREDIRWVKMDTTISLLMSHGGEGMSELEGH
jgi:hypothetical protein